MGPADLRDLRSLISLRVLRTFGPVVPNRPGGPIKTMRVLGTFGPLWGFSGKKESIFMSKNLKENLNLIVYSTVNNY